jgi:hypothetical protein
MNRLEFTIALDDPDLPYTMDSVADRLVWLHTLYGQGDDWGNRSWLHPDQPLTGRWAFGNYAHTMFHAVKFAIWLPDDIRLLYDLQWP